MQQKTTARGDKYYIARETPLYGRRRCCFPWPLCCVGLFLLGVVIFGITSTVLAPDDRLVLVDNTTQPMVNDTWTDVNYDETLIASARWLHVDAPPGPNAEVVSVVAGTYSLGVGLHAEVVLSLFGISAGCQEPAGPCNTTSDCCTNLSLTTFCYQPSGQCQICPNVGQICANDTECCPFWQGDNVSAYCNSDTGTCSQCRSLGQSCSIFGNSALCCADPSLYCDVPTLTCMLPPPTVAPPSPNASCGVCPCTNVPCTNDTDCCDPYTFPGGEASLCQPFGENGTGVCYMCGYLNVGDFCNLDWECDCNGTAVQCLPSGIFSVCAYPPPAPTPPPTLPYGPNCTNQSQCADTQYCSPGLNVCVTCASIDQDCFQDPANQCNCTQYNNYTNPMFCFLDLLRCTTACANASECPAGYWCNTSSSVCVNCLNNEGFICCSSTQSCVDLFGEGTYCSPSTGICEPCAYFNESCSHDPPYACGCNVTDNLYCDPNTQLCAPATPAPTLAPTTAPTNAPTLAPTTAPTNTPTMAPTAAPTNTPTMAPTTAPTNSPTLAPTAAPTNSPTMAPTAAPTAAPTIAPSAAPTEAPICPPVPTINARLVRQRNPNPAFVVIAGPFVPVLSGSMYVFSTTVVTQVNDIYKVQWYSPDCPFMALTPIPFALGTLGAPGGTQNTSAYLTATLI